MLSLILLLGIAFWVLLDYVRDAQAQQREMTRRAEKAALYQRLVATTPDSPLAYERLGDALHSSDDLEGAIEAYEKALALEADNRGGGLAGWQPGGGIETKLRLTRLDRDTQADPALYGQTMRTRQQVCRACGQLGQPQDTVCSACHAPLPVDSLLDVWQNKLMRAEIKAEILPLIGKIAIVLVAITIASWMPLEVRGAIGIAAVIVIPMRLLKKLGEG